MSKLNTQIENKLKDLPHDVQEIARCAIQNAKRLDASKLAAMLEPKVKSIARKEINK